MAPQVAPELSVPVEPLRTLRQVAEATKASGNLGVSES